MKKNGKKHFKNYDEAYFFYLNRLKETNTKAYFILTHKLENASISELIEIIKIIKLELKEPTEIIENITTIRPEEELTGE